MKKQFVAVMQNDGFVLARPVYTQCRRFSVKGVLGIDLDSVSPSLGRAKWYRVRLKSVVQNTHMFQAVFGQLLVTILSSKCGQEKMFPSPLWV